MTKKKHQPVSRRRFVGIWTLAQIAAWVMAVGGGLLLEMTPLAPVIRGSMLVLALLTGAIPAFFLGWMQQRAVETILQRDMRGWIGVSVLGGLASGLMMYLFINAPTINPMLSFIPLLLPLAVIQWSWLSRRVKSAWVWLGTAMVQVLLFTLPAQMHFLVPGLGNVFALVALVLYPILTGAAMYHLWTQDDDGEAEAVDAAMLERLSDESNEAADDEEQPEQKRRSGWHWRRLLPRIGWPRRIFVLSR
jgi:hypothetical protein